jgi:hypothetical protein
VSVYAGDDGVVQVVKLKTLHGYLKHPVAKSAVVLLNDGKYSSSYCFLNICNLILSRIL